MFAGGVCSLLGRSWALDLNIFLYTLPLICVSTVVFSIRYEFKSVVFKLKFYKNLMLTTH